MIHAIKPLKQPYKPHRMNLVTVLGQRYGKRYAQTAAKVLKGQKGKRYGKSMNKGF